MPDDRAFPLLVPAPLTGSLQRLLCERAPAMRGRSPKKPLTRPTALSDMRQNRNG
jgi:hypothetical protein